MHKVTSKSARLHPVAMMNHQRRTLATATAAKAVALQHALAQSAEKAQRMMSPERGQKASQPRKWPPGPFRLSSYRLGLWRNPLFCTPLDPSPRLGSMERQMQSVQLSFLCPCGQRIALKALGCCPPCYCPLC